MARKSACATVPTPTSSRVVLRREEVIGIAIDVHRAGVATREKGRPARRADRRLAIGVEKRDATLDELIHVGRADVAVAERADGVE